MLPEETPAPSIKSYITVTSIFYGLTFLYFCSYVFLFYKRAGELGSTPLYNLRWMDAFDKYIEELERSLQQKCK
jgi:hypothetical protein